jgi:magnesium-transporting ATPase (P-type)
MLTGALGLFLWELQRGTSAETARTMAVCAVVVSEMFYLFNSRHILNTALSREGLLGNRFVLVTIASCAVLQLGFVYLPPMQGVFGSTALGVGEWSMVLLAGLLVFTVAELEKVIMRRLVMPAAGRA